MKKILSVALLTIALTGLTGCVVTPPHVDYVGPRVGVIAPYPVYQERYYGGPRHRHGHRHGDHRW